MRHRGCSALLPDQARLGLKCPENDHCPNCGTKSFYTLFGSSPTFTQTGGIDRSSHNENVGPTIVIEIQKTSAPLDRRSLAGKAGGNSLLGEESFAIVVVERNGFVGEVGLYDVQKTIAVIVSSIHSHPTLGAPVFIESHSSKHAHFSECAVVIVFKEQAWSRIIRHIDVRPAIVVV